MTVLPASRARWQVILPPEVHSYWHDAMVRSGIPTCWLDDVDEPRAGASVLVLPDQSHLASAALRERAQRLYHAGVPAIAGARAAADLCGARTTRRHAIGLGGSGPLFELSGPVRLNADVEQLREATHGVAWPGGGPAVTVIEDGRRFLLALPLPAADTVLEAPPQLLSFELPGARAAQEIVAGTDHGALRRLLCGAIRWTCLRRGLPFAHLGPAPGEAIGTFAFRIDADGFRDEATRALAHNLDLASIRATWFIDVERHARGGGGVWVRRLGQAGHEVQSHGYHHYTYSSAARNRRNFEHSLRVLEQWGARATAAAAPFGTWNSGLQRTYSELGLRYSSEFSRLYDDHPGRLATVAGARDAWQVPIHPVCPILLRREGLSRQDICAYFGDVVRQRLARGEPAVLYGHPIDDLQDVPELLPHLRQVLADEEARTGAVIWRPTLSELHAFYVARSGQHLDATLSGGALRLDSDGPAPVWVDTPGGRCLRVAESREIDAAALTRSESDAELDGSPGTAAVLVPRPWSRGTRGRLALRGRRLRLARLWREVKTTLRRHHATPHS